MRVNMKARNKLLDRNKLQILNSNLQIKNTKDIGNKLTP